MNHEEEDLETLIDHHQRKAEESGNPPRNVAAWRAACRKDLLQNDFAYPGHIANAANGVRVNERGEKITRWKEVRGDYGMDYVYSPTGTATAPAGYSLEKAKHEWEQYQTRQAANRRRVGRS